MSKKITDVKQIHSLLNVSYKKTWIKLSVMLVFTVAFVVFLLNSHITFKKECDGYAFPEFYPQEEYLDHMFEFLTGKYPMQEENARLLREEYKKNLTTDNIRSVLFIIDKDDMDWVDEGMDVVLDGHPGQIFYASAYACGYDDFVSDFGEDVAGAMGYYPGDMYYVYMCLVNDGDKLTEGVCTCTVILDEIALGSFIFG